jgi:hypothetical protein
MREADGEDGVEPLLDRGGDGEEDGDGLEDEPGHLVGVFHDLGVCRRVLHASGEEAEAFLDL